MTELAREVVTRPRVFLRNALWWFIFTDIACWLQTLFPGVDFLVVGLVVSLQEGRWQQTIWLSVLWILIQEGSGSLAFGSGLLWYAIVAMLFSAGAWFFETKNFLFTLLFGAYLGVWHYLLVQIIAALQDYQLTPGMLLRESYQQAVIFVPSWYVTFKFRRSGPIYDVPI
ncbi:conserved membrane hypothetical protein [Desulfovibrionales bacterium]